VHGCDDLALVREKMQLVTDAFSDICSPRRPAPFTSSA
jgi:hypothetical protein